MIGAIATIVGMTMEKRRLWGKTQSDLDAERAETIARREYLARRDAGLRSPEQLARFYADRLPNTDSTGQYIIPRKEPITTVYFGQDVEPVDPGAAPRESLYRSFDSVCREVQSYEVDEYERAMRGDDDAGYGTRWVTGIALALLVVVMIGVALVML